MRTAILTCPADLTIDGYFAVPTSKSESNRLLVSASLMDKAPEILGVAVADDVTAVVKALRQLNAVEYIDNQLIRLVFPTGDFRRLDVGAAGTALRFLLAASCFWPGTTVLDGSPRLRQRPIQPLVEALQQAGAQLSLDPVNNTLPITVNGNPNWQPTDFEVDASQSSQFLSALLLLAPKIPVGTKIKVKGAIASSAYTRLTLHCLEQLGFVYNFENQFFTLKSKVAKSTKVQAGGDWSAASYAFSWALLGPSKLTVNGLDVQSAQGDRQQLAYWQQLGLRITSQGQSVHIEHDRPIGTLLPPFDFDFSEMPDLAQTFAFVAPFCDGPCTLRGLHTLPLKETDRLTAIQTELERLGCHSIVHNNSLVIMPLEHYANPGVAFETYDDHRMAMAIAPMVRRLGQVKIHDPGVVSKSFPDYYAQVAGMDISILFN